MNLKSSIGSIVAASRRTRVAAAGALIALALGATALLAPAANASTPTVGDFSTLIPGNPVARSVDDCTVVIGFVYDGPTNWRHIGGVLVNCGSRHSIISATVALFYYNGSTWVQYGSSKYYASYNSTGSGYLISDIGRTYAYCTGGWRGYWMVGATVSTERTTKTVDSEYALDPPGGSAC